MKVQSLELRCFKRFGHKVLNFVEEETGLAKDLVVLIGENGAGKSRSSRASPPFWARQRGGSPARKVFAGLGSLTSG